MNVFKSLSILAFFSIIACTQFVENNAGKNNYSGNDGCISCHTNAERLKLMAPAEEHGGGAGGG